MSELLTCQNLSKRFGSKYALSDVSLTLGRGQIIGLLGPNGSGKTTLIKLINGLLVPTEGWLTVNGLTPGVETKRQIAYLPERTYLNRWMKVRDILKFFSTFYDNFNTGRALQMLDDLGIDPQDVELYILDEPIGGVDPAARDYILRTILSNYNPNSSILLSTHLIADIENMLDDVIFLQDGQISLHATVDEIRAREGKSVDELFREVLRC